MKTEELFHELLERGGRLWAEDGELVCQIPPEALTVELRESLRDRKGELVELLGEGRQHVAVSPAQKRLWFLEHLVPGDPSLHLLSARRLQGPLEVAVLERCLGEISRRHETLRATFTGVDGRPCQVVAAAAPSVLPRPDLRRLGAGRGREEVRRRLRVEAARPFDLARGPLTRAVLFELAGDEHVLFLNFHHAVSDGWSQAVFYRELAALYEAFAAGRPSPLPEPGIQYADYAAWQHQWLRGREVGAQLAYWRRQLDGVAALELPTDRPRSAGRSPRGGLVPLALPGELLRPLRNLGAGAGASLFMTLLAAFMALLSRVTGQSDVAVGSPIANRHRLETEGLIGFFVNTLVLRGDLSGRGTSFRELLARVREVCLAAYDHQDLPFEKLVEELAPQRDLTRTPLFQVMASLRNTPAEPAAARDLVISPFAVDWAAEPFDLSVSFSGKDGEVLGSLTYDASLFHRTTASRLARSFEALLSWIAGNADRPLRSLSCLTAAERQQLLVEWNDGGPFPGTGTLDQLFEAQAGRTPEAVAVVSGGERLTYAELARRAGHLARRLRSCGVAPEVRVGIALDRSPDMVVGLLAVLKAGGAYVPLDPEYPAERLRFLLDDSGAEALLTHSGLSGRFAGAKLRTVLVDREAPRTGPRRPEPPPACSASPRNLAYLIYTSGSTGRPKGVAVEHRSAVFLARRTATEYGVRAEDRVLQFASLSFDTSVEEIFMTLLSGATLVLRSGGLPTVAEFLAELAELAVTVVDLPTAYWHELVAQAEAEGLALPPSLRLCIFGGERASEVRIRGWRRLAAGRAVRLVDGYGPTEATVTSTFCELSGSGGPPSIGRPFAGVTAYVLGSSMRSAEWGAPGELFLGGAGLARGYHDLPASAAASFLPNPFSREPGSRLYRTGDRVRWRGDGRLAFLGRVDHQVKVRGFRIEPEEVEAALTAHAGVHQAVVVPYSLPGSDTSALAGFFVPGRGEGASPAELRAYLGSRLPAHMVPAVLEAVGEIPLTPSAKVDRAALTRRALEARKTTPTRRTAPRTATERKLAGVWGDVLKIRDVGVHDNFFDLGGDSILTLQIVARARQRGLTLTPQDLFRYQTVAELASAARAAPTAPAGRGPVPRPPPRAGDDDVESVYPLTPLQEGMLFHSLDSPESPVYFEQTHWALDAAADVPALRRAWERLVERHAVLRTVFVWEDRDRPLQVVRRRTPLPWEEHDWRDLDAPLVADRLAEFLEADRRRVFDLAQAPPLRLHRIRLPGGSQHLVCSHHHILLDGWSFALLREELRVFYPAFRDGRPVKRRRPRPFRDYVDWLGRQDRAASREFWRRGLAGFTAPTPLPGSRTEETERAAVRFRLPPRKTAGLTAFARRRRLTLSTLVQAAWSQVLAGFSGGSEVVFGAVSSGRPASLMGSDSMIGLLITTFPVRVRLSWGEPVEAWLESLQSGFLELRLHEHVPLAEIRALSEIPPGRPLFESLLVFQSYPAPAHPPGGDPLSATLNVYEQTHYAMTLSAVPGDGLSLLLEYDPERFGPDLAERTLRQVGSVLESLPASSGRPLAEPPFLTPEERRQLFFEESDGRPAGRIAEGLGFAPPRSVLEEKLAGFWESVLHVGGVGIHDNFFELGGDSILSLRIVSLARRQGLALKPRDLFQHPTVAELARVAGATAEPPAEQGEVCGPVPLTPIQRWFFELGLPEPWHESWSAFLRTREGLEASVLRRALGELLRHHDALRLRFTFEGGRWTARNAPYEEPVPFLHVDLARLGEAAQAGARRSAAERIQRSLDLASGPLLRLAAFDLGAGKAGRLLVVLHHLATDRVSWSLFFDDLETACQELAAGAPRAVLPPKTTSFMEWAERLSRHARSRETLRELDAYLEAVRRPAVRLPLDDPTGRNTRATAATVTATLGAEATGRLLRDVPGVYQTRVDDVLLTALLRAFARWTGRASLLVALEGHGREEVVEGVDLSRTLGWFTSIFPVWLELGPAETSEGESLKAVKEQLRRVPRRGIGYGLLRYLSDDPETVEALRSAPQPEVVFNYLSRAGKSGDASAWLSFSGEPSGPSSSRRGLRSHLLEVNAGVDGGRLWSRWTYSRELHRRETVAKLAGDFVAELEGLVAHCLSPGAGGYTPSDFPLAGLSPSRLDALVGGDRNVESLYPLTPVQEGILFHARYAPESSVYFEQEHWELDAGVDAETLRRAWERLVERHGVLRTVFVWEGLERPLQVVRRHTPLPWKELDWREPGVSRPAERLERFLERDRRQVFDLAAAPPFRLCWIRLADGSRHLVWSHHHVLLDGWSAALLREELRAFYFAFRDRRTVERPRPRPFRDYVAWLAGRDRAAAREFWRSYLAGFSEPSPMPERETAAPPSPAPGPATARLRLSREATAELVAFGRRHRLTVNTLLQGAWSRVLASFGGGDEVVFGTVSSGRPASLAGSESMVGLLVNTLPVRVRLAWREPVDAWLADLQSRFPGLGPHEHVPLADVQAVSEVRAPRPLFESLLVFQSYPVAASLPEADRLAVASHVSEQTHYPVTLNAVVARRGLLLEVDHDPDRFAGVTVARWVRQLGTVLEGFVTSSGRPLGDLPLWTPAQRHQVLREWNDTALAPPAERTVLGAFARQAAARPDATAVVCDGVALSYRELDRRARRLAGRLRRLGVGCDARVGLAVERSPEMAVAVLGILRAGAAYVPLDPSYPSYRLRFMLAETESSNPGATVVLTQESLRAGLAALAGEGTRLVCLDGGGDPAGGAELPEPHPESLAYVIYTSGSTGRPKGIALSHRALSNLIEWHLGRSGLVRGARMLQYASLSFDASFHETFATWCSGGTLHVVSEELRRDVPALARYLVEQRIEKVILPVVVLHRLAEECLEHGLDLGALTELTTTGEPLHVTPRVAELFERFPHVAFHNHYGPSETHVVTAATLHAPPSSWPSHPSIGRPIARTRIHLLDARFHVAGVGQAGELYVGGASPARGYVGRPATSAEKLLPDPFAPEAGARLYRTGDQARWLPDGTIDFLGRLDHQVKIRGFRVEVGEVEAVLARHPAVSEAAVVACEDGGSGSAERWLAGFVVGPAAGLRAYLEERLPAYMVPRTLVSVEALPLSPTGKVDRGELRRRAAAERPKTASGQAAARTPGEEMLAEVWGELLGVRQVGVRDDFFQLGGHSLLATQVVSRIRRLFGVELPVRSVFERPTLAALAAEVDERRRAGARVCRPPVPRPAGTGELPLSFAQQRLWFLQQLRPASFTYDMPDARRLLGRLDVVALRSALGEVVRRHEVLRTRLPAKDGRPYQEVMDAGTWALPVVDLTSLPLEGRPLEARRRLEAEGRRPFRLEAELPLRSHLWRLGAEEHVLFVNTHHVAFDGWSQGILNRELAVLYGAFVRGAPSPLPEPEVQYADFALWQRGPLQEEALETHLAYWRRQLDGLQAPELPVDRPRPAVGTGHGESVSLFLPEGLARSLRELSVEAGASSFMTFLSAFVALLHRLTGQTDVAVGSPIANRRYEEVEGLIGFFVNTLVLRSRPARRQPFRDLLGRVRELCLEAYLHQDLPFERLVEELRPNRDLGRPTPFVQVMLVLQNAPSRAPELPGLGIRPFGLSAKTAHFDLMVFLAESGGGFRMTVDYSTDLFHRTTLERLARSYARLLADALRDPDSRLGDLPLLSSGERHQALAEWNGREAGYPEEAVHRLFEAQALRTPEAVALVEGERRVSYSELDRRATLVSGRLVALGVEPGHRVGLLVERSVERVVAMLAVLKAGAAYVPLDPGFPRRFQAFLLRDAGVSLLLTRLRQADEAPVPGMRHAAVEDLWEGGRSPAAAGGSAGADHLAYVMYTSGSTGRPKGVAVTHRGIVRLVRGNDYARLADDEVFLHLAPAAFDASTLEIWGPLLNGGRLVLAPPGPVLPEDLRRLILRHGVTSLWLTAGLFHVVAQEKPEAFRPLRQLLAGGDVLSPVAVRRALAELRGGVLVNGYGPTEGTTFTCCHTLRRPGPPEPVPIGRPIRNARTFVVDADLVPVPIGVAGELLIGGDGLAQSYWGRPARTAEAFVPDPFTDSCFPGRRLYRSGDRVRHLPDGTLAFLGRRDDQVKIRGFRVEPAEVAAHLRRHPNLRDAAVVAVETPAENGSPTDRRLVAYVVADPPAGDAPLRGPESRRLTERLRRDLAKQLPDYMIPAHLVVLESLPLTVNGKLDRQALPPPAPPGAPGGFVAPRGGFEEILAHHLADLLGVGRVGADDDFFELGGHSLLAVQLTSRIERCFDVKLPLDVLFRKPTVAGLARVLEDRRDAVRSSPLVALEPGGTGMPFFCVHPAGGHALCFVSLCRELGPGRPFYGLEAQGRNGEEPLPADLESMAAGYVEAVRAVQPHGPYLLGGWSMGGVVAYEMARQVRAAGEEVALLALIDSAAPLGREPAASEVRETSLELFARDLGLVETGELRQAGNPDAALAGILEAAKRQDLLAGDVEAGRLQRLFRLFERNVLTLSRYVPRPYDGRITLFRSEQGGIAQASGGWEKLAAGGVEGHEVPGDHFSMLRPPHVRTLAERLGESLRRAPDVLRR